MPLGGLFGNTKTKVPTTQESKGKETGLQATDTQSTAQQLQNLLTGTQSQTRGTSTTSFNERNFREQLSGLKDESLLDGLKKILETAQGPQDFTTEQNVLNALTGELSSLQGLATQEGYEESIGRQAERRYSDALRRAAHLSTAAGYKGVLPGQQTRAGRVLAQELQDSFFRNRLAISGAIGKTGALGADLAGRLRNAPLAQGQAVANILATAPFTRRATDETTRSGTSTTDTFSETQSLSQTLSDIVSGSRQQSLSEKLAESESKGKGTTTQVGKSPLEKGIGIVSSVLPFF